MKVRMKVGISGTRNGTDWPGPGQTLDVDDDEGMALCRGGLAEPVAEPNAGVETAVPTDSEQRAAKKAPAKKAAA